MSLVKCILLNLWSSSWPFSRWEIMCIELMHYAKANVRKILQMDSDSNLNVINYVPSLNVFRFHPQNNRKSHYPKRKK